MMKAIFFDRDNTLIIDSHYMHDVNDLKFYPDTFEVLYELKKRGYQFFIISNQSGIGRGYFTEKQLEVFHKAMLDEFEKHHIEFVEVAYCPHHPNDNCDCRKPHPKILLELMERYNVDKSTAYMVGDRDSDYQCGINAGINAIKIKDGHELKRLLTEIK